MSRFVVAIALLAAGMVAAVPVPALGAQRSFRSPTGKLGCMFYSASDVPRQVRCEWRGSNDRAVVLGERGKGRRIRVTDSVLDARAAVLAYGRSTTFGRLKCTSRRTGITCRNRAGHGFEVSTERQRVF